ncbi:MAG: transporter associated domain-containing protein [Desulfuromonadales bacterium]
MKRLVALLVIGMFLMVSGPVFAAGYTGGPVKAKLASEEIEGFTPLHYAALGGGGLITMKAVLRFIFGHLMGPVEGQYLYEERDQNRYVVPGDMKLSDFNNLTHFGVQDPRMTTIGGVAFRHLDRLPRVGDRISIEDISTMRLVLEAAAKKDEWVAA